MNEDQIKNFLKEMFIQEQRVHKNSDFLNDHYDRRNDPFEIVIVDNIHLLKVFGKLRHQVYIEEERISPDDISNINSSLQKIELDEHDDHSLHYLLYFRPLDMPVGGLRLLMPNPNLPFFGIRPLELSPDLLNAISPNNIPKSFEVSRFIFSKDRFKIVKDYLSKANIQPQGPEALLHLFKPIYNVYQMHGLTFATFICKKSLIRLLEHVGINVQAAGQEIQYNGSVQPAFINIKESIETIKEDNMKLYNFLQDSYEESKNGGIRHD